MPPPKAAAGDHLLPSPLPEDPPSVTSPSTPPAPIPPSEPAAPNSAGTQAPGQGQGQQHGGTVAPAHDGMKPPGRIVSALAWMASGVMEFISACLSRGNPLVTLTALLLVGMVATAGGWYWYTTTMHQRAMMEMQERLVAQRDAYEAELARLLGEERRAEFLVIRQFERDGELWNRIRFVEHFNTDGTEGEFEHEFELPGREFYIDSISVKFEPSRVREGRARNFAVFRRAFTNRIAPDDGIALWQVSLDRAGELARASNALENSSDGQRFMRLLQMYLRYPDRAHADGVRLIEGEAKYINPRIGYIYQVVQVGGGGLSIIEREMDTIVRRSIYNTP